MESIKLASVRLGDKIAGELTTAAALGRGRYVNLPLKRHQYTKLLSWYPRWCNAAIYAIDFFV